jgi:hypothetical protein
LSLFIVWWVGFEIAMSRNNKKSGILIWAILLLFGLSTQFFRKHLPSATIIEMGQGILMATGLYLLFIINDRWLSPIKNGIKSVFNFFFEQAGHGSYALYALHYPLFIYMNAKGFMPSSQIFFTFVLLFCCIMIEKWTIKQKFSFFKLNFLAIKHAKIG